MEDVEGRSKVEKVPSDIRERFDIATLIAMSGNGVSDLFHGEIRQLKLVA